jgi:hypothetical protein
MSDVQHPIASVGIKECSDVLALVDASVDQVVSALADGRVSTVEALGMLVRLAGPLRDALDGVAKLPAELKDLDQSEVQALTGQLFVIGQKIVEAVGKLRK